MHVEIVKRNNFSHTFEGYAALNLQRELKNLSIPSRIVSIDKDMYTLTDSPPDLTVSFIHLFPTKDPLCAITGIAHLVIKEKLSGCLNHLKHPLAKIIQPCRETVSFLKQQGVKNVEFLPFPAPSDPFFPKEKIYDVVLFNDLIDRKDLFRTWKTIFSLEEVDLLTNLLNAKKPPLQALCLSLEKTQIKAPHAGIDDWLIALEEAISSSITHRLVEAIPDIPFHLFGEHIGNGWLKRLKNKNVFLHDLLPYTFYFEVLKQAKILVCPTLTVFDGIDSWLFAAIKADCLILTPRNSAMEALLGKDFPFFYPEEDFTALEEKLHFYLENDNERKKVLKSVAFLPKKYDWEWFTKALFEDLDC